MEQAGAGPQAGERGEEGGAERRAQRVAQMQREVQDLLQAQSVVQAQTHEAIEMQLAQRQAEALEEGLTLHLSPGTEGVEVRPRGADAIAPAAIRYTTAPVFTASAWCEEEGEHSPMAEAYRMYVPMVEAHVEAYMPPVAEAFVPMAEVVAVGAPASADYLWPMAESHVTHHVGAAASLGPAGHSYEVQQAPANQGGYFEQQLLPQQPQQPFLGSNATLPDRSHSPWLSSACWGGQLERHVERAGLSARPRLIIILAS